jgi:mono/diheme cytochrome c family protein
VGCGSSSSSGPAPTGNAERGAQLFAKFTCVHCHTVNGVGGEVGPELTHNPAATDYASLKSTLHDPPSPMAFVKDLHLTDKQIADISTFADSNLSPKQ